MLDTHKCSGKLSPTNVYLKNRALEKAQCMDPCFVKDESIESRRIRRLLIRNKNSKPFFEWLDGEEAISVLEDDSSFTGDESNEEFNLLSESDYEEDDFDFLEDECCSEENIDSFQKDECCDDDIAKLFRDECCDDAEIDPFFEEECCGEENPDMFLDEDFFLQSGLKEKRVHKPCGKSKFLHQDLKRLLGFNILLVTNAEQLEILGQVFRPIFCGKVIKVTDDAVTLFPVQIRMHNAPEFIFPTPLSFPLVNVVVTTPFDCVVRFPIP